MTQTITKTSVILTATILVVGMMVMTPGFSDAFAKGGAVKTQISAWNGELQPGTPTIDSEKSFVVFNCNSEGTLTANGHLHKTNKLTDVYTVTIFLDNTINSALWDIAEAPVNKVGNANFHAVVEGLSAGEHTVQTHINRGLGQGTYYVNGASGDTENVTVVCG